VPQVYKHLWWTSTTKHLLNIYWKMIPSPKHPKSAFVLVRTREHDYGWLLSHLCIHFTSHIYFHVSIAFYFGLIQPSTSSLFTCESGHRSDASSMHLVHYPFGGQQITTHDTIQNTMYVLAWKSGHIVWKERYTPLHQEFHYKLISTSFKRTKASLQIWCLLTWHGR